ncbi:hypothetical protein [Actinoplanes sp. NPDC020271]|uniref:hypothetical protein n=1 Tax=Actinoplanes sp. NPDC020271 TaxID=3363896 RepID=UPI0037B4DF2C
MTDISWARRMDAVTGGAMVLTVDAVVFLMTALVGAPFVVFFMADGDDPVGPIWPMATVWVVSAALGSASAAAAFLIGARSTQRIRQAGAATALATAAATAVLVATSISASPVLAAVSALFAAANLGAAKLLFGPERATVEAPSLPEVFLLAAPLAEAEVRTRDTLEIEIRRTGSGSPDDEPEDEPEDETARAAEAEPDDEPDDGLDTEGGSVSAETLTELDPEPVPIIRLGRPRSQAALRTLGGITLPPRARRSR